MSEEKRQRDSKGRFVKGCTEGKPYRKPITKENASEYGKRSQEAQKRKRLLKEELRDILLEETTPGSGMTKMQSLIHNVLKNTLSKGRPLDLKILAEVLGEMEVNVNLNQSEKPKIVFDDDE